MSDRTDVNDRTHPLWHVLHDAVKQSAVSADSAAEAAGIRGVTPAAVPVEADPPLLSLAYLGDAIYDAYVRARLVGADGGRPGKLHDGAVARVRAAAQARVLDRLEPHLTDAERDIIRRARNAKPGHVPRGAKVAEYHRSTAFEALLGYLLWAGQADRLGQVLAEAWVAADELAEEAAQKAKP